MSEQPSLLEWTPPPSHRYGETYSSTLDFDRLNRQQRLVFDALKNGGWWTLRELADATGQPEASISARLRDFRNMFGLTVDRRRRTPSLHEYRLDPSSVPRA